MRPLRDGADQHEYQNDQQYGSQSHEYLLRFLELSAQRRRKKERSASVDDYTSGPMLNPQMQTVAQGRNERLDSDVKSLPTTVLGRHKLFGAVANIVPAVRRHPCRYRIGEVCRFLRPVGALPHTLPRTPQRRTPTFPAYTGTPQSRWLFVSHRTDARPAAHQAVSQ